jgi:flagellar assembly protein FliH
LSNLRQGILRAVRLLPDVVKIGVEAETALPSRQEEEQLLSGEAPGKVTDEASDEVSGEARKPSKKESTPPPPDPFKELTGRIAALQTDMVASEAAKTQLVSKIASLEAELARSKDEFARKEREMTAGVEAAREQARAEGRTKGYDEGLESGHRAGLERARVEVQGEYRERFTGLVAALEGISTKLEENFSALVTLNQPRMLRLWQEMLKKMLHREMTLAPDAVLDVLADVLSRLSDKNHLVIYVCPDDMRILEERMREEFADTLRGVRHLELKSDTNVDRGSCIVETNLGIYDARWRTQLDQIETVIEDLLQKLGKAPETAPAPFRRKSANGPDSERSVVEIASDGAETRSAEKKPVTEKSGAEKSSTRSTHRTGSSAQRSGRGSR